ncbi:JPH2 protein, partial [Eolophus roseicapillus]|nr:JPH2 protein [Eolophus roseicapilla]
PAGRSGGGSPAPPDGEGRPGSRGWARPAEQMEIEPLQRKAREPDVEHFQGYHSYAVRTSPATDYEEEPLIEPEPPSPEPRGDVQRRGGTPVPQQEREEKPVAKAEVKPEPPRAKEPKQRPSPERRAAGQAEPTADKKTEAKGPRRIEPKAGAKGSPGSVAAVAAAQEVEECEEGPNTIVICMVILLNIGLAILFVHFLT